jgi:hypothetical protein
MSVIWQVNYEIEDPIHAANSRDAIPELGLTFQYNETDKLTHTTHTLSLADESAEEDAVVESQAALKPVWEALSFSYGVPVQRRAPRTM